MGKNNAPVSLTVRRTSDRTSTPPDSCAAVDGRPGSGMRIRFARARALDGRADNADDPSWRSATARSYILLSARRTRMAAVKWIRSHDVGTGRLSPLCDRDRLGARAAAGRGLWDFSRPARTRRRRRHRQRRHPRSAGWREPSSRRTSRPRTSTQVARAAREAGVDLEWVEGDAGALPFPDGEFDVVTSCFGAMFAPDHQAVANELVRVCRPGGVIGMMNFTPGGAAGDFFRLLAAYAPPPPPGAHAAALMGNRRSRTQPVWRARVNR